jgi:transglutaminase-like putative cysteine protease
MTEKDLEAFLEPAPGIQCDHPEVVALARRVVRGAGDEVEAARRLFYFARDTVRYSVRVPFEELDDYLALNTLARGKGFCVQKAALLCTLARALGIPSRLGFADIKNHQLPEHLDEMIPEGVLYFHCFVEWWVAGAWRKATPSFDAELSRRWGWRLVEFSPEADAMLPATDLSGRPHIEYLRYHGWRLGVPLEEFIAANTAGCGREAMDAWRRLVREEASP